MPFSTYASFLVNNRGWPGETAMRRAAERQIRPESASPGEVVRFFSVHPPLTPAGHAHHALALQASGQVDRARAAARQAWTGGGLASEVESRLLGQFGPTFTQADHDARVDVLLSNGDRAGAVRMLPMTSAARRPVFEARLALQTRAPDAQSRFSMAGPAGAGDPGLLIDRANYIRASGDPASARQLLAQRRSLSWRPQNPARFMETMVAMARAAAADNQWTTAYQIASQVDDIYPPGTDVSRLSYDERDEYTNLTWLAGTAALRGGRNAEAAQMFDRYGRAAQSSQTRAKGFFWAARAATAGGQAQQATNWLNLAASSPDQFYGQLALERLGRTVPPPPPGPAVGPGDLAAFGNRPLAQAIRYLGALGRRSDQTDFIRALAATLQTDQERATAALWARGIGRLDMGVWAAREGRANGASFYAQPAFPTVTIPAANRRYWAAAHGIIRQESSFERSAISSANARGMMQLIPGTAQIEARRAGVAYSLPRLTEDPDYNVLLGSNHLASLLDRYGGNLILAAVAYNAGPGRVPQWIERNGDPRLPGTDVLRWIEDIPFSETRNYVQRVVENAVVYDTMQPGGGRSGGRASFYLGRNAPL
jgi:soluble lytic murein transglycosylase